MNRIRDIGLYVHIPFCRQRCDFCAFYLEVARPERINAFCSALDREIRLYLEQDLIAGRELATIYFGGGTPTAIPAGKLTALLETLRTAWRAGSMVEATVEAHPSTVTGGDLRALVDAGFTRLSLGAESMDRHDLKAIGRPGTVVNTITAVREARAAGFTNISLDLMYGLPGQTVESWTNSLYAVLALDPTHVSCYALTIEEGTRFAFDVARGSIMRPDESLQIEMESVAQEILTSAGFTRYEISNYAKTGAECRHNLLYWTDQDYLGLGPSAQSYVKGVRFGNIADLTAYIDLVAHGRLPVTERTVLSEEQQQREALVFGLRLIEGVSSDRFERSLSAAEIRKILEQLTAKGLIQHRDTRMALTPLGRRYADTVAAELF